MKKLIILFLFAAVLSAGPTLLNSPNLSEIPSGYSGLASNGVTEIAFQGDSLTWFGTGGGLSFSPDFGENLYGFFQNKSGMPKGGISAIDVQDSVIWIAAIFDSSTSQGSMQTGGGLSVSVDNGISWNFIPQPIDSREDCVIVTISNNERECVYGEWAGDSVLFLASVTPISNTTWDLSIGDNYTYIVSWAGGVRRTVDFGQTWQRVPLPSDNENFLEGVPDYVINPQDPAAGGNHNHKGFSVLAYGDTIWVGTANGINRGIEQPDGSINWVKYCFENSGISGDFVVSLERQFYNGIETIWAVTLPAGDGEKRGVSYSRDGGGSWKTTLLEERAYSFSFQDSVVYVSTEDGLFKSFDGDNWSKYQNIEIPGTDKIIYSENVYCAAVDEREGQPWLWLGTGDGIGKTADDGLNWEIYHYALSTSLDGQPEIYAYPNPFAPGHHNILDNDGHVRIRYYLESAADVQLEVYDFGMNRAYKSPKISVLTAGDHDFSWDGKTNDGRLVANGTYFCKLIWNSSGKKEFAWTKLIVVN